MGVSFFGVSKVLIFRLRMHAFPEEYPLSAIRVPASSAFILHPHPNHTFHHVRLSAERKNLGPEFLVI
jgi:hypothetical protein